MALYSFKSNNDQELSFEKGDRLEILDRPSSDPDWYKARNNSGQIGLVPRNYLQELNEYLSQPYRDGSGNGTLNDSIKRGNHEPYPSPHYPPQPNNTMPDRPNLAGKSWYYGAITRNQCDTVLNQHGHDGDFLIRDSETNVMSIDHDHMCSMSLKFFV